MQQVPGDVVFFVDADPVAGTVSLVFRNGAFIRFSAVQSEHLRTLLQKAELIVETGVGEMKDP